MPADGQLDPLRSVETVHVTVDSQSAKTFPSNNVILVRCINGAIVFCLVPFHTLVDEN